MTELLTDVPEDVPGLLPSASAIYARKVAILTKALNRPDERQQAAEALRMLIEKIVLTPGLKRGEILATLHGELRTILEWTEREAIGKVKKNDTPGAGLTGVSVSVVERRGLSANTLRRNASGVDRAGAFFRSHVSAFPRPALPGSARAAQQAHAVEDHHQHR